MSRPGVLSRARTVERLLARPRFAALWVAAVVLYLILAALILFLTSALSRGGSLPDAIEVRLVPVTIGKWLELYGLSPASGWRFPLARLDLFWEPRPEWWQLSGTLLFVSSGFFLRMLLIAVLGASVLVMLVALARQRASTARGLFGSVGGAGLAGVGSTVGAPLAAFAGG
jgi:hypothetical protein